MLRKNKEAAELQELGVRLAETAPGAELLSEFVLQDETKNENDLLTPQEVAKICKVHVTTVRRWIANGDLPAILLPRYGAWQQYRVQRCELEKVLELLK